MYLHDVVVHCIWLKRLGIRAFLLPRTPPVRCTPLSFVLQLRHYVDLRFHNSW